jgi:hypothetical protein
MSYHSTMVSSYGTSVVLSAPPSASLKRDGRDSSQVFPFMCPNYAVSWYLPRSLCRFAGIVPFLTEYSGTFISTCLRCYSINASSVGYVTLVRHPAISLQSVVILNGFAALHLSFITNKMLRMTSPKQPTTPLISCRDEAIVMVHNAQQQ